MKILVVSDIESKYIWEHFDRERFRDIDLIISCGDLSARYLSFLVTMIPCPLLYVPGNHDKTYLQRPPEGCVNIDGRIVDYRGITIMGLGGCRSPHQAVHEYSDLDMWKKVRKLEPQIHRAHGIDLFVTHAPSLGLGDFEDQFHQGFEAFRYLDDIYHPAIHFYGHCHLVENPSDRRAVYLYNETVMCNAFGYKIIEYEKGRPLTIPLGCASVREMPTPIPPKRFPFLFR